MTDQTAITYVEARSLHESATNPRRHFDERGLEELAASIREQGIINALLVRPIRDDRGEQVMERGPKDDRKPRPSYEVICGARRLRAARAAGLESIPIVIRDLNDAQALETQVVENLQREDVHPLDEAHGFRALMESCRYDVTAVAAKVGRSQSYIYQRLKLCELIEPVQTALWEEKITAAHAILIARLQPHDQAEALKQATPRYLQGDHVSAAHLDDWIRSNILLDLHAAPFAKADAPDLVPSASVCKDCKKRTGYTPALWSDLAKRDLCADRACYHAKTTAHVERALAAAKTKGERLLRLSRHYGATDKGILSRNDYSQLKSGLKHCEAAGKGIIVGGEDDLGQIITVCPRSSKCKEHWGSSSSARAPSEIAAEKKRKEAKRAAQRAGQLVLERIMERARAEPFGAPAMRLLYAAQTRHLDHNAAKRMSEQLGLEPSKNNWGGTDYRGAIVSVFDNEGSPEKIATATIELALQAELASDLNNHQFDGKYEHLRQRGKDWGVNVAGAERQVAAEEKQRADAAAARAKKPAPTGKKQAKAKGKAEGK